MKKEDFMREAIKDAKKNVFSRCCCGCIKMLDVSHTSRPTIFINPGRHTTSR